MVAIGYPRLKKIANVETDTIKNICIEMPFTVRVVVKLSAHQGVMPE